MLQGADSFTDLNVSGTAVVNNLTVSGTATFNGNIVVAGHIITSGDIPSVVVLPAAGTDLLGATEGACVVTGDDTSGIISITTGTNNINNGAECTITFAQPFGKAPHPVLTAHNEQSAVVGVYVTATTTGMTINFAQSPAANVAYTFSFITVQ